MSKILILSILFLSFNSISQNINGKVVAITDGDTFKLLTQDSIVHRIRIANIDCPERKQPYSKKATQFTSKAIFGKQIKVNVLNTDRYGRLIGVVIYNDTLNLNYELVKNGMAWHYLAYSKDKKLDSIETYAKTNCLGLWNEENPIAPWDWRKRKKKKN